MFVAEFMGESASFWEECETLLVGHGGVAHALRYFAKAGLLDCVSTNDLLGQILEAGEHHSSFPTFQTTKIVGHPHNELEGAGWLVPRRNPLETMSQATLSTICQEAISRFQSRKRERAIREISQDVHDSVPAGVEFPWIKPERIYLGSTNIARISQIDTDPNRAQLISEVLVSDLASLVEGYLSTPTYLGTILFDTGFKPFGERWEPDILSVYAFYPACWNTFGVTEALANIILATSAVFANWFNARIAFTSSFPRFLASQMKFLNPATASWAKRLIDGFENGSEIIMYPQAILEFVNLHCHPITNPTKPCAAMSCWDGRVHIDSNRSFSQ